MTENLSSSFQARLEDIAVKEKKDVDSVFLLYLEERFLYRLSLSPYADRFVLKGEHLLYSLSGSMSNSTNGMEFLGKQMVNDSQNIKAVFEKICDVDVEMDGVIFDKQTIKTEQMGEKIRISVNGSLGNISKPIQMDIGLGDVAVPKEQMMEYPTLLKMESPVISVHPLEFVIAEKFEGIISMSVESSRLKDCYDIHSLITKYDFEGRRVYEAIFSTFERRGTNYQRNHVFFKEDFAADEKQNQQWNAFLKETNLSETSFVDIIKELRIFLKPIYESILNEEEYFGYWDKEKKMWMKTKSNSNMVTSV
jgi:hypothetical protein